MVLKSMFQQLTGKILATSPPSQRAIRHSPQTVLTPVRLSPKSTTLPQPMSPTVIDMRWQQPRPQSTSLSHYLRIGSQYHPLCRHSFVEQVIKGQTRRASQVEFRTCALAAAYAGAYGADTIREPKFSYSMATWRLSNLLGKDISNAKVSGPTGRTNNSVIDEMIQLVDENYWTREGVADWLESIGY